MARQLTPTIESQIRLAEAKGLFIFKINDVDFTDFVLSYSVESSREFGSSSAVFTLNNDNNKFGSGASNEIKVGDEVKLIEKYKDDSIEWKKFFGIVNQRNISKTPTDRIITISCLDYISVTQFLDIDLEVEGTKVSVENERLIENFLSAPNDSLSQVFNFNNDNIATKPAPVIMIHDRYNNTDDPQFDGFQIDHPNGQLTLGSPLNVKDNYYVVAKSYSFYTTGIYAEDVLESILKSQDGYGNFLFGESSATQVVENHLQERFSLLEGTTTDTMTPNYTTSTITIRTQLSSDITAGTTSITLDDASGFPSSGTGKINGDTFTWSGKSGNDLTGIPSSGSNALGNHKATSYVKYEADYAAGRIWYLTYSHIITTLTSSDFTVPGGSTVDYVDLRFGRIILDAAIATNSTVTCDTDYVFSTLQASGIEINRISFRPRELENRFEAINKLKEYLAPNYIIRTEGDNKIWASFLTQKTNADYTLHLIEDISYLEDTDLYTRVVLYGKNKSPSNLVLGSNVDFVTTGEQYKAFASQVTLSYDSEDGDYYVYGTLISNVGYIDLEAIKPIVYVNSVAIDDTLKEMVALPVVIDLRTRTETKTGCHGISKESYTKIHAYYYYKIKFSHANIEPSQPIYCYDATGALVLTIAAYDLNMDYARGIYNAPGSSQSSTLESISTATYWVFYSTENLEIDYDNVLFKIRKALIPDINATLVQATFEYWHTMTPVHDIGALVDGRWDTQVQTEFYAEVPSGYNYAILDLGSIQTIQAIDIVAGFFKPDEQRKFDIDFTFSLHSSTDNSTYTLISDETHNVRLTGGESVKFEEDELGADFQARYLKIVLEDVKKIDFEDGVWVVAFTDLSVYTDIVLKSESKLTATTTLTNATTGGESTIVVGDTSQFTGSGTAYLNAGGSSGNIDDAFTYTGKTATTFTGCSGVQAQSADVRIVQKLEDDTTLYDDSNLLGKMGDRLYKEIKIDPNILYIQSELDYLSKNYLKEFIKNHNRVSAAILFAPYLRMGQTVKLVDASNSINQNYFIEAVSSNSQGTEQLTLARYP